MATPNNYTFNIQYDEEMDVANWNFSGGIDKPTCIVDPNDTVTFMFEYVGTGPTPRIINACLMVNQLDDSTKVGPFTGFPVIQLKEVTPLPVGAVNGTWPFCITFAIALPTPKGLKAILVP